MLSYVGFHTGKSDKCGTFEENRLSMRFLSLDISIIEQTQRPKSQKLLDLSNITVSISAKPHTFRGLNYE
jgi:hypothetical protein